ncbi:nucleotide pyrophosphohydrolase [Alkalibaculum sp. M08DMB]|uniref:Nucleotide pyrophosphohydrolase n=1 Tax=Alkalibaculum sporogenes TaxID=2655001 RepID=A0A6A7K9B9_9FIRM|nr:nucleoside triphosphate pyrophosphohydrolase family protein [Alkalibaculum sporogenes]MPW25992.1 nucleotide pyrophosphohydrolase [Alkalibaculum sporogenes]
MKANQYQLLAMKTANPTNNKLLNSALGLCQESGEVAKIIKAYEFQGDELNKESVMNELGEMCWFIVLMCTNLRISFDEVLEMNIRNLIKKHPKDFKDLKDLNEYKKPLEDEYSMGAD